MKRMAKNNGSVLLAYTRNTDPLFFAMRFMDGLREAIRSAVHMQLPTSLNDAYVFSTVAGRIVGFGPPQGGTPPRPLHHIQVSG